MTKIVTMPQRVDWYEGPNMDYMVKASPLKDIPI